ncbi:MAG TPA: hypothetical protein VNA17_02855 [Pyrinomonadaceae bacterium]|nr:hypothetical protein [Pyrinomonadaceae bacterium]
MVARGSIIVDAAAIVASIDELDQWHADANRLFRELAKPLLTCESAVSESCHLLKGAKNGPDRVLELASGGAIKIEYNAGPDIGFLQLMMFKYRDVPMSFADACLVRMSEIFDAPVFTFDTDFRIYRRNKRNIIPLIGIDN